MELRETLLSDAQDSRGEYSHRYRRGSWREGAGRAERLRFGVGEGCGGTEIVGEPSSPALGLCSSILFKGLFLPLLLYSPSKYIYLHLSFLPIPKRSPTGVLAEIFWSILSPRNSS